MKMHYSDDRMYLAQEFVECSIIDGPFYNGANKHSHYEIEFEDEILSRFRFLLNKRMIVPFYYLFSSNLNGENNRSTISTR